MSENTRPRGVYVYRMPEEIGGPAIYGVYALLVRHPEVPFDADGNSTKITEARMVHYEGVGYLVTDEKPWCWTDYDPAARKWTLEELLEICTLDMEVDLADWVRWSNDKMRLEDNFWQLYQWSNHVSDKSN